MNLYEAQEFFKKLYPEKKVEFLMDDKCIRQIEIVHTDGLPNINHHVQYEKVKVMIEGLPEQYVSIAPHRMNMSWNSLKQYVNNKTEVWIHPSDMEYMDTNMLREMTGMETQVLEHKKQEFVNSKTQTPS